MRLHRIEPIASNAFKLKCALKAKPIQSEQRLNSNFGGSEERMATRQERIDAFLHEGEPPADQLLEVLCEDHVGTYVVPFLCRWRSGDWRNAVTGARIEATIIGWRERIETEDRLRVD